MAAFSRFEQIRFVFEEREAWAVLPRELKPGAPLAVKCEYREAFPATEEALLEAGFVVCFNKNDDRWGSDEVIDRKARFVRHVQEKWKLADKCVPVGMSCGGLIAVKFASSYPELVSCLYLDAPVMNFMSCPMGCGVGEPLAKNNEEILNALKMSISELICCRDMPMDRIPKLIEEKIPVALVAGDSDRVVPYIENGILLQKAYEKTDIPFKLWLKPGCDHHPHGLEDVSPVVDFIKRFI